MRKREIRNFIQLEEYKDSVRADPDLIKAMVLKFCRSVQGSIDKDGNREIRFRGDDKGRIAAKIDARAKALGYKR